MALTLASLGIAGAGAASGIMQANSASKAAAASNDIALRNYYLQRQMAQEQMRMAQAGSTDSRGNRTEYIPGVGWVTTPTERTRSLQTASDNEQLQRLTTDAIRARLVRERASQRGLQEGAAADSLLTQLTSPYQERPADVRGLLTARNVARANSGAANMRKRIGMQSLRQGGSGGYGNALTRLAQTEQADRRSAIADANYDAPVEASARTAARQGDVQNRYSGLAAGARAPVDVAFQPDQIGTSLSEQLAARARGAPGSSNSSGYIRAPQIGNTENTLPARLTGLSTAFNEFGKSPAGKNTNQWLDGLFSGWGG